MTITSSHNQRLKEIRKLRMRRRAREQSGRFVAEGEDLLAAADVAGWQPVERFCAAGSGLTGIEVEPQLLASASGLGSGTRTLAVYEERWAREAEGPLCIYLHGIHDPGNVGTIMRSAEAFGASSVAFGPGSADPFSPKAVRASMGAIFGIPVVRAGEGDLDALPGAKIALVPGEGQPLRELSRLAPEGWVRNAKVRTPGPELRDLASGPPTRDPTVRAAGLTILIGAEREGLPRDVVGAADHIAHIPIVTHSLNAAMAATVALYELRNTMARA